jgi:hypothetical protein
MKSDYTENGLLQALTLGIFPGFPYANPDLLRRE